MSCCAGASTAAPPRPPLPHALLLLLLLGAALLWPSAAAFPPALGDPTAGGGPLPFQAQGPFDLMPFAQQPPSPPLLAPAAALYPSQEDYEAVRSTLRLLEPELELEEAMGRALLLRDLQAQMQAQQLALAAAREAGPMAGREELLPPPPPPPQSQPEGLPAPLPLVALDAREEPPVKKMKSYMSLCLFKICNMGRKRTNRS